MPFPGLSSKAKRPRRAALLCPLRPALRPGFASRIDGNRLSRRGDHLCAMLLALEVVGDIPIVGTGLAGCAFETLDVAGLHQLFAAADIGATAARAQHDASTAEPDVFANLPAVAGNYDRRGAAFNPNARHNSCLTRIGVQEIRATQGVQYVAASSRGLYTAAHNETGPWRDLPRSPCP